MMNKYLKTENALIEIEYKKNIINTLLVENLEKYEFQRLYIECDIKDILNVYNELNNYTFKKLLVFIRINNYSKEYNNNLKIVNDKYYIIIKSNINNFKKIENLEDCFYEIKFNYSEKNKIIELLNNNENIILNINYKLDKISSINKALLEIVGNSKKEVFFSNLFIDKELIYKSPYNIYLNNKNSNRNYGDNIPRNIYIDKQGNVYCINIKNKNIIIGNINNNSIIKILNTCKKTNGYKNFIKYNEKFFIDVLNQCPFQTIDLIAFIKGVIKYYE